jgi:hypothetical protein
LSLCLNNHLFLAHLSCEFKWAILITCCPSVHPSIDCKLLHFQLPLQNQRANFNQIWHKWFLGGGDSSLFKWRRTPFSKYMYSKDDTKKTLELLMMISLKCSFQQFVRKKNDRVDTNCTSMLAELFLYFLWDRTYSKASVVYMRRKKLSQLLSPSIYLLTIINFILSFSFPTAQ